MPDSLVLVLTSTVSPAPGANVVRSDPDLRRKDYLNSLAFWLNLREPRLRRIVFLENSNTNLDCFRNVVQERNPHKREVEFISTEPTEIPIGIQHGYGEFRMLDEGISRSAFVHESTHFIKATGRVIFPDIARLLDHMPKEFDVLVDCRIPAGEYRRARLISALIQRRNAYATTQLAVFRKTMYERHLRGIYREMKPWMRSGVIECAMFDRLKEISDEVRIVWRFPVNCDPVGTGARFGANYQSASRKTISVIRAALRPFDALWI